VNEEGVDTVIGTYLILAIDNLKADEYVQIQVAGDTVEYRTYYGTWYNE
jgi:hypothetical protein